MPQPPHSLRKPTNPRSGQAGAPPAPAWKYLKRRGERAKKRQERGKKSLDSASYKLYYVNYAIGFFRPAFAGLKPEQGYLFPPSAYCPHDCEWCTLPCKLSRYHLGPHTCGARHRPVASRQFSTQKLSDLMVFLLTYLLTSVLFGLRSSGNFRSHFVRYHNSIHTIRGPKHA